MSHKPLIPEPVIAEVDCWGFNRDTFGLAHPGFKHAELVFDYPTVYIVYSRDHNRHSHTPEYLAYVGETNDIVSRTSQHLGPDAKSRDDWRTLAKRAADDHGSASTSSATHISTSH